MAIPEPELVAFTITGAKDWPMLVQLVTWGAGIFCVVFGGCFSIIMGLIVYMWYDLKKRITSQRKDDRDHCHNCKQDNTRELDALWDNIKACCAASGVTPITRKDIPSGG
jgi:uncharacterized membrane protein YraQ (UPF0718 family)